MEIAGPPLPKMDFHLFLLEGFPKTKLLSGIFMFCWLLFVFLVVCGVTFCILLHNKTSKNQKQQQKHGNTQK